MDASDDRGSADRGPAPAVRYVDSTDGVVPSMLTGGFFVGWPDPPDAEGHLRVLEAADRVWLAIDDDAGLVVGFVNAVSDGVLSAYVPLLEVLPSHQGHGIGTELTRRMLHSLRHLYMVDLLCDPELQPFYERSGMSRSHGMAMRNYEAQPGARLDQQRPHDS